MKSEKPKAIRIELDLTSWDRIPHLEVIQNGKVIQQVACTKARHQKHTVKITPKESGWFLVRAIADNPKTFRFASTGPFYVEIGPTKRRISRGSTQFFLDWVDERIGRVRKNITDENERKQVLEYHQTARRWWSKRLGESNAQ